MISRKPRVVIMPVRASRRSSTALVVVVVPWTMRSMSPTCEAGLAEGGNDAESLVVGCGRHLGDAHAAAAFVDQDQVGEGAADIDAGDDAAAPGFAALCLIFLNHARNPKRRI